MQKKLKIIAGAGVAILATGGAAVAATAPDAAQDGLGRASEATGFELPASRESHPTADDHPGDPADEVTVEVEDEVEAPAEDPDEAPELPEASSFGQGVATEAQAGVPQEDGRAFGEQVSSDAREAHQPDVPTADDNPGTQHAEAGADNAPDDVPTADDNPGSAHRP